MAPDDPINHHPPQDKPPEVGRRDFFRKVALRGIEKAEDAAQSIGQRLGVIVGSRVGGHEAHGGGDRTGGYPERFLRPPGALEEIAFADACSRCGDCVRACPAQCIVLDPDAAGGLPHIVPRRSPCVVCEDLSCMKACPTGALTLVDEISRIDMGLAVVDQDRCLRNPTHQSGEGLADGTAGKGEDCRVCIQDCPPGESAIGIDPDGRIEIRPGCIGCGVCERVCPTQPSSVVIIPRDRRPAGLGQH